MTETPEITSFLHPAWPVLFQDNHLLGLYKPAGLLMQGDNTGDICLLDLAKHWIKIRYDKPGEVFLGVVHRLDRPVAGVALLARTSKAAGRLCDQFRERAAVKKYLAVVSGILSPEEGGLRHVIRREGRRVSVVSGRETDGKEARLSYRVRAVHEGQSLVEVTLETGRKHQIRLQLAASGHPILGDLRYGAAHPLENARIALFALSLTVTHPTTRTPVVIQSPLPAGWPWPGRVDINAGLPWDWKDFAPYVEKAARAKAETPVTHNR